MTGIYQNHRIYAIIMNFLCGQVMEACDKLIEIPTLGVKVLRTTRVSREERRRQAVYRRMLITTQEGPDSLDASAGCMAVCWATRCGVAWCCSSAAPHAAWCLSAALRVELNALSSCWCCCAGRVEQLVLLIAVSLQRSSAHAFCAAEMIKAAPT